MELWPNTPMYHIITNSIKLHCLAAFPFLDDVFYILGLRNLISVIIANLSIHLHMHVSPGTSF
jgi:hypothetical protein